MGSGIRVWTVEVTEGLGFWICFESGTKWKHRLWAESRAICLPQASGRPPTQHLPLPQCLDSQAFAWLLCSFQEPSGAFWKQPRFWGESPTFITQPRPPCSPLHTQGSEALSGAGRKALPPPTAGGEDLSDFCHSGRSCRQ